MPNVVKLKISFTSKIRLWFANYVKNVSKRLKYLEKKARE